MHIKETRGRVCLRDDHVDGLAMPTIGMYADGGN